MLNGNFLPLNPKHAHLVDSMVRSTCCQFRHLDLAISVKFDIDDADYSCYQFRILASTVYSRTQSTFRVCDTQPTTFVYHSSLTS